MLTRKMRGMMRLVASVTVSVILLPYILRLYLALSPNATAGEVWLSLVQAAPFGETIATAVVAVWGEAQSGVDSLLEWLASQKLSFPQHFSIELGKLLFTSVLVQVISALVGRKLLHDAEGGLFNNIANAVFQVLLTFTASLAVDVILDVFQAELTYAVGLKHELAAWGYTALLGGGGIGMLVVCGVVFLDAVVLVGVGCLKLTTSYGIFLWLLLVEMQNGSVWIMGVGIIIWLVLLWLLQQLESIFLPK